MKYFLCLLFMSTFCWAESSCSEGQTRLYRKINSESRLEEKCETVLQKNLPKSGLVLVCTGEAFRKCASRTQESIDLEIKNWKAKPKPESIEQPPCTTVHVNHVSIGPGLQKLDDLIEWLSRILRMRVWVAGVSTAAITGVGLANYGITFFSNNNHHYYVPISKFFGHHGIADRKVGIDRKKAYSMMTGFTLLIIMAGELKSFIF